MAEILNNIFRDERKENTNKHFLPFIFLPKKVIANPRNDTDVAMSCLNVDSTHIYDARAKLEKRTRTANRCVMSKTSPKTFYKHDYLRLKS